MRFQDLSHSHFLTSSENPLATSRIYDKVLSEFKCVGDLIRKGEQLGVGAKNKCRRWRHQFCDQTASLRLSTLNPFLS
jgi:hypothetical protein